MPNIDVCINGKTFNINCSAGEEDSIISLADKVNGKIAQIAHKCKSMNESALLSFTLLSMADDIKKLEDKKTDINYNETEDKPIEGLSNTIQEVEELIKDISISKENLIPNDL